MLFGLVLLCAGILGSLPDDSMASGQTYKITYVIDEACGVNSPDNPSEYESGMNVHLVDAVPQDGYVFEGWYSVSFFGSLVKRVDITQGDQVLYAYWYYTCPIVYDLQGGVNNEDNPEMYDSHAGLNLGDPSFDGRGFGGWYTRSTITKTTASPVDHIEIFAVWNYTLEYDLQGGTSTGTYPSTYNEIKRPSIRNPVRAGYEFEGWVDENGDDVDISRINGKDYVLTAVWSKLPGYTITYHDGDTVVGTDTYTKGVAKTDLLEIDGGDTRMFNGWCIDGDHSKRILSIQVGTVGDLDLYAWWIPVSDVVGHYYTLSYTKTTAEWFNTNTETGKLTVKHYQYDPMKGFYSVSVLDTSAGMNVESGWDSDSTGSLTWTYAGMGEYKGYLCEVYRGSGGSLSAVQYIYDGWIPVHIEYSSSYFSWTSNASVRIVYDLLETGTFDITADIEVKGYGDVGIDVSGSGLFEPGSEVTLSADISAGTVFKGWYNADGKLLSESKTYTFAVYLDTEVYALNDKDPDFTYSYKESFRPYVREGLTDVSLSVYCTSTGETVEYTDDVTFSLSTGGEYRITYSGTLGDNEYYGFYIVFVDGDVFRTYNWDAQKVNYSLTVSILYSDFQKHRNDTVTRSYTGMSDLKKFVNPSDNSVVQIAKYIIDNTRGMDDGDRLYVLLRFVQILKYQYDSVSMGQEEYFKYPVETLYDMNGDCEDTAFLFCSIACAMGYQSALILFDGHMASAVQVPDGSVNGRSVFKYLGEDYLYCETTATGYGIGEAPSGYEQSGNLYKSMISIPVEHDLVFVEAKEPDYENDGWVEHYHCETCGRNYKDSHGLEEIPNIVIPRLKADLTVKVEGDAQEISVDLLKELRDDGRSVEYRFGDMSVMFRSETIAFLCDSDVGYLLECRVAEPSDLTKEQNSALGDGIAYLFRLTKGDFIIDVEGSVTLTLLYSQSLDVEGPYLLGENGDKALVGDAVMETGCVVFQSDGLGVYCLDIVRPHQEEGTPFYLIVATVIAILVFIGFMVMLHRHR